MSHRSSSHQWSFQHLRNQRTRKEPQTKTLPSSVSAAVWLSPADTCTTFSCSSTGPGEVSDPSAEVSRPRAPSSLQPKV